MPHADILFVMLVSMAIMGAQIAKIQRTNNQTLRLYASPGSLASAVACAAASDLPAVLRSSDTKADMKSVLQEYTFTINKVNSLFFLIKWHISLFSFDFPFPRTLEDLS